jgi:hypothetical protein
VEGAAEAFAESGDAEAAATTHAPATIMTAKKWVVHAHARLLSANPFITDRDSFVPGAQKRGHLSLLKEGVAHWSPIPGISN